MTTQELTDRARGALIGAFIGDALALGPHWYYDLDEMRRRYGDWIDDYTAPYEDHYHAGLAAGDATQAGVLLAMTAESLVACGRYDEADFCRRLDEELFPRLDGTPMGGPGGYTSQSIRECWRKRVEQGLPWGEHLPRGGPAGNGPGGLSLCPGRGSGPGTTGHGLREWLRPGALRSRPDPDPAPGRCGGLGRGVLGAFGKPQRLAVRPSGRAG